MSKKYDYIIAGGGCAGLSLAYQIHKSSLNQKSILIVDKSPKTTNDHTWSFWTKQPTDFEAIVYRSWQQLHFLHPKGNQLIKLKDYQYQTIRAIDFYNFVIEALKTNPNIDWLFGEITDLKNEADGGSIAVNGQTYQGNWLFNSCFAPDSIQQQPNKYFYLQQHFKGWLINTNQDYFDTTTPTLFDFNIPQQNAVRFMYTLPFSPRQALIEYTIFSEQLEEQQHYDQQLKQYIKQQLGIKSYDIEEVEWGVIPMSTHPMPRQNGSFIINIGTNSGRAKSSTGYAFTRIQTEAKQIVQALIQTNQPVVSFKNKRQYLLYDSMLLHIMQHKGGQIRDIFAQLFKNNPIDRLFRFLDEETTLWEDILVMNSVPPVPFLKAFFQHQVKQHFSTKSMHTKKIVL